MAKLIMLIGIQGSGKSTLANKLIDDNTVYISSDNIREEINGSRMILENESKIANTMFKRAIIALEDNKNVIYDAMNLKSTKRINLMKEINKKVNNVDFECFVLITNINECIKRNNNRKYKVPMYAIRSCYKAFQFPTYYEGFKNIKLIFDNNEKNRTIKFNNLLSYEEYKEKVLNFPVIDKCIDNPHENAYHKNDISRHMYEAYKYSFENYDDALLNVALMLHDCGKGYCKKKDEQGIIRFKSHDNISTYLAAQLLNNCSDISEEEIVKVCSIISLHMKMHNYEDGKMNKNNSKKFKDMLGEDLELMRKCSKSDTMGD